MKRILNGKRTSIAIVHCVFWFAIANGWGGDVVVEARLEINGETFDRAVELLQKRIDKHSDELASFYVMQAECYYPLNKYREAENAYRKGLEASENGDVEYAIGKCLIEQVKYHEALAMFRKALDSLGETGSRHMAYLYKYHIAWCLFEIGRNEESIEMFRALINEFPEEDVATIHKIIKQHEDQNISKVRNQEKKD